MQVGFEPQEVSQVLEAGGLPVLFKVKGKAQDPNGKLMMIFQGQSPVNTLGI